jgi:hypothetical protein
MVRPLATAAPSSLRVLTPPPWLTCIPPPPLLAPTASPLASGYHFDGSGRRFFEGWYWKVGAGLRFGRGPLEPGAGLRRGDWGRTCASGGAACVGVVDACSHARLGL